MGLACVGGFGHYLYSMISSQMKRNIVQVSQHESITTLTRLIHKLHSHVTRLGLAVSTRRARKIECATERKLAA